jgi:hypothetical protein
LVFSDGTITSNYNASIQHAATHAQHKQYFKHRNQWWDITAEAIKWDILRRSLQKHLQTTDSLDKVDE